MDINIIISFINENITIFIGLFVSTVVMGTATLYDNYKSGNKKILKSWKLKPSSNSNKKRRSLRLKGLSGFSDVRKKLTSFIRKKPNKAKLEKTELKSELKSELKPLKPKSGVQKLFGNLRNKLSSISFTLPGKGNKKDRKKLKDSKAEASSPGETDKENDFDLDKIVESKKDELDFEDDLLTEMSTASSLSDNDYEVNKIEPFSEMASEIDESLNSDLMIDDSEFDIGFGEIDSEPSDDDISFDTEEINFEDESDSLLASLKKDIVVRKEEKIDFMAEMQGENLDIKLLKTELEDVLGELKKHRQYSSNN